MYTYIPAGSLCFSQLLLCMAKLSFDLKDDLQSETVLMNVCFAHLQFQDRRLPTYSLSPSLKSYTKFLCSAIDYLSPYLHELSINWSVNAKLSPAPPSYLLTSTCSVTIASPSLLPAVYDTI